MPVSTERARSVANRRPAATSTTAAPTTGPNGRASHRAADDSSLARLYMTSDLRAATGLSRTHLDFYLREGLVIPTARTESGYLLFDDSEADLLREIIAERQAGTPLRDIRRRIGR